MTRRSFVAAAALPAMAQIGNHQPPPRVLPRLAHRSPPRFGRTSPGLLRRPRIARLPLRLGGDDALPRRRPHLELAANPLRFPHRRSRRRHLRNALRRAACHDLHLSRLPGRSRPRPQLAARSPGPLARRQRPRHPRRTPVPARLLDAPLHRRRPHLVRALPLARQQPPRPHRALRWPPALRRQETLGGRQGNRRLRVRR